MENYSEDDLVRIKELLRHTGEFIAYFELAETKMMQWRETIEHQAQQLHEQMNLLHQECTHIQELLSQTGAAQFKTIAENALAQGEHNLLVLERQCNQFIQNAQQHEEHLQNMTEQCLNTIEQYSIQTAQNIANQLDQYDAHQFHRIASESCDHVARVAHDAVNKSNKLLNSFQLKSVLFAVLITIMSSFVISLYLSDELPWELHHHAMNERQAGKILIHAWPNLSQEEKEKIMNHDGPNHA